MGNELRSTDVLDADFVDAYELGSSGSTVYLSATAVSTTGGTKVVVIALPADGEGIITGRDHPAEAGDKVLLSGTSGGLGDGLFTIATVLTDLTFSVVEAIGTSVGGSASFRYPAGAKKVGFDPAGTPSAQTTVQAALAEALNATGGDRAWRRHFMLMGA